jgi:hypothetical protein
VGKWYEQVIHKKRERHAIDVQYQQSLGNGNEDQSEKPLLGMKFNKCQELSLGDPV